MSECSLRELKRDERPLKGGWAPGYYYCACNRCGENFIGDKRAITCADCAYENKPESEVSK